MRRILILLGVAGALIAPSVAQASTSQSFKTDGSPVCFKWHFREYRDGLATKLLWRIDQTVYWCTDGYGHFTRGPTVTRSHDTGDTWAWGGWTSIKSIHRHKPNRWEFREAAALHSKIPLPFTDITEHNYPYIRMTAYPSPGQSTWASSCGCGNAVTVVTK